MNPQCEGMNRAQQPWVDNHAREKAKTLKRMHPSCAPRKQLSLVGMVKVVHMYVKKPDFMTHYVLQEGYEVTDQQRDGEVTQEFPYGGSLSRQLDVARI